MLCLLTNCIKMSFTKLTWFRNDILQFDIFLVECVLCPAKGGVKCILYLSFKLIHVVRKDVVIKPISNCGLSITTFFTITVVSFFCNTITTSFTTTTSLTIHWWCSCGHDYSFPTTSITHPTTAAVIIRFFFHDCLRYNTTTPPGTRCFHLYSLFLCFHHSKLDLITHTIV